MAIIKSYSSDGYYVRIMVLVGCAHGGVTVVRSDCYQDGMTGERAILDWYECIAPDADYEYGPQCHEIVCPD